MLRAKSLSGAYLQNRRMMFAFVLLVPCFTFATSLADERKKNKVDGEPKDVVKAELEKLSGTWVRKSMVVDGKPIFSRCKYTFSKNTYTMEWEPNPLFLERPIRYFEFELDVTKDPKVIFEFTPGRKENDWTTVAQIYRFRGELLEICSSVHREQWGKPPVKFDGAAGSGQMLITLERVKADKPKAKQP